MRPNPTSTFVLSQSLTADHQPWYLASPTGLSSTPTKRPTPPTVVIQPRKVEQKVIAEQRPVDWMPPTVYPLRGAHDMWAVVMGAHVGGVTLVRLCSQLHGAVTFGMYLEQWRIHGGSFKYPNLPWTAYQLYDVGGTERKRRAGDRVMLSLSEYLQHDRIEYLVGVDINYPLTPAHVATPHKFMVPQRKAQVWGKFDFEADLELDLGLCIRWERMTDFQRLCTLTLREQAKFRVFMRIPRKAYREVKELIYHADTPSYSGGT